ncbi:unnamed protein product [Lathyrus sativus]|nr:unnamed protein product [Lathyrus sativus]
MHSGVNLFHTFHSTGPRGVQSPVPFRATPDVHLTPTPIHRVSASQEQTCLQTGPIFTQCEPQSFVAFHLTETLSNIHVSTATNIRSPIHITSRTSRGIPPSISSLPPIFPATISNSLSPYYTPVTSYIVASNPNLPRSTTQLNNMEQCSTTPPTNITHGMYDVYSSNDENSDLDSNNAWGDTSDSDDQAYEEPIDSYLQEYADIGVPI